MVSLIALQLSKHVSPNRTSVWGTLSDCAGLRGSARSPQVAGQHFAWPAQPRSNLLYELGRPGPRRPVGEAQAGGR
eukprot:SAG11_NODE_4710_length_1796_cov_13.283441_2_plen_76_part_00